MKLRDRLVLIGMILISILMIIVSIASGIAGVWSNVYTCAPAAVIWSYLSFVYFKLYRRK